MRQLVLLSRQQRVLEAVSTFAEIWGRRLYAPSVTQELLHAVNVNLCARFIWKDNEGAGKLLM